MEDDEGNISKELSVLQVAPLKSHAGYRLEAADPAVFSDGGEEDPDSWVCSRSWPHIPIPQQRKRQASSSSTGASSKICGSAHSKLKKDLLLQHHNLVKLLAALDIDACKEYQLQSAPAVLSQVRQGKQPALFANACATALKL